MGDKERTSGEHGRKAKESVKETTPADPEQSSDEEESSEGKEPEPVTEPRDDAGKSGSTSDSQAEVKQDQRQPTLAERLQYERRPPRGRRR